MSTAVDLQIRELSLGDAEAGAALGRSRGWAYEPAGWRFKLEVGRGWGAFGSVGDLLGTVLLTAVTAEVSVVGSMLVAEAVERRGVGAALLARALDAADDRLITLFATRSGRSLYERSGFRPVGRLGMHRGVLPAAAPTGTTRPATAADLPALAALDAAGQGGDRTWLLAALLRFATAARVQVDPDGAVRGFAAAWPSQNRQIVGPIIAADDDAAVAVLSALAADVPGPARVDVHVGNAQLEAWLAASGFEAFARTTVMVHGSRKLPGRRELVRGPIMQSLT